MQVPEPGGEPDLTFESIDFFEDHFDHAALASKVLWPLIETKWPGGDWQKNSRLGMTFMLPVQGEKSTGQEDGLDRYVATLGATTLSCTDKSVDADKQYLCYRAQITVDEDVESMEAKAVMLEGSRSLFDSAEVTVEDGNGGTKEYTSKWLTAPPEEVAIRKTNHYTFDSDGDWGVETRVLLIAGDGGCDLVTGRANSRDELPPKLLLPDVELIEVGCKVLGARSDLFGALRDIKAKPLNKAEGEV